MKKRRKISDWTAVDWLKKHPVLSAVLSAIAGAIYTVNDTNVMANHIGNYDFLVKISTYLLIGAWGGLLLQYFLFKAFGKTMDHKFDGLKHRYAVKRPVIIAGLFGAAATAISLYGHNEGKTILVSFFSSLTVVMLLATDKRNSHKGSYLIPVFLAFAGSLLMAYKPGGKLAFDVMFVPLLIMLALSTKDKLNKTELKAIEMGACNYQFWRFLWLAIGATTIVIASALIFGYYKELLESIRFSLFNLNNIGMILVTFIFVGISGVLDIGASQNINVSSISVITALHGVFTFGLTVMAHYILSGTTYKLPQSFTEWQTTLLGAGLTLVAVALAKSTIEKIKQQKN